MVKKVERMILHSDLNNFYASVECLYNPAIRNSPVAVCGDTEKRHGIVLAKNNIAKKFGVKTGETLWQAKEKCPGIVFVPPSYDKYIRFSKIAREIYNDYSDRVESFGLDECWVDISGMGNEMTEGKKTADSIRKRIREELGITASIGVSWNKIFAKLGSDYKKPNATTVITKENFKGIAWPLPVRELLYVGSATNNKLKKYMIYTIGDLAQTEPKFLKGLLGVNGIMLWQFANGYDTSAVEKAGMTPLVKSIGNSTTMPYDVTSDEDIKITLYVLCESVAARLREQQLYCNTVQIGIRNQYLLSFERQGALPFASNSSEVLQKKAFSLYQKHKPNAPIRSLSVRACNLQITQNRQLSLLDEFHQMEKQEKAEAAIDEIRRRFGHFSVQRGIMLTNTSLSQLDPKSQHTIHPVARRSEK